ncbi:hypothetical protein [Teredinibacter purpureus]|uniref:hypothetical protein n=1 Tax=Teredinibacter purpureus TaxID=2731756 RepID=UPI0005F78A6A|nr:hypothetical protein [Teredinibacter purpureus]
MKTKLEVEAFKEVRKVVHTWKPIAWATYDDDEPDLDPSDPDYESAKSMLEDELNSTIKSIVKQLHRVKTENDMIFTLHRAFTELDDRVAKIDCTKYGKELFYTLKKVGAI